MNMCSDINDRVGTLHIKMFSDVHNGVGTLHMKMCLDVYTREWGHNTGGTKDMGGHCTLHIHC